MNKTKDRGWRRSKHQAPAHPPNPRVHTQLHQRILTSALSLRISDASSSHCWVYCHLAVFSLSTTCSKWTCFCSSSSFCSKSLLKLLVEVDRGEDQHPHGVGKREDRKKCEDNLRTLYSTCCRTSCICSKEEEDKVLYLSDSLVMFRKLGLEQHTNHGM